MFHGAILSAILEFVILFVSNSYRLCPVLFRAIKKNDVSISNCFLEVHILVTHIHTHTDTHRHTHTHTHTTIAQGKMQCVAFRQIAKLLQLLHLHSKFCIFLISDVSRFVIQCSIYICTSAKAHATDFIPEKISFLHYVYFLFHNIYFRQ